MTPIFQEIHAPTEKEKFDFFAKETWKEEKDEPKPKKSDEEITKAEDDKKEEGSLSSN